MKEIKFSLGDLIEYTRPVKGEPSHDRPITVRGVVVGFSIAEDPDGTVVTRVWVREGASQYGTWEETENGRVMEGITEKETELVIWKARNLLSFDNFRVVREGNSPVERTNFVVD